jgi:hypothetical protein
MGERTSAPVGRNGLVATAGIALVLMVLALAAVFLLPVLTGQPPAATPTEGAATDVGFACDANEAVEMLPFLNGIVRITPESFTRLDEAGQVVWTSPIEMQTPVGTTSGGRLLVHDAGGFTFAVFGSDGLLWSGKTDGHIDAATMSASGHVVVLSDEVGFKGVVGVHDATGTSLFQWMSSETGYVLAAAVDPTGTRLDVSALYTDGATAHTLLRSFTIDGVDLAECALDPGSAFPLIVYDELGRTLLCGEEGIVAFLDGAHAGEIAYRKSAVGIRTVRTTTRGPVWVRSDDNGIGLLVSTLRGGVEGPTFAMPSSLGAFAAREDFVATASGAVVTLVDVAKGTQVFRRTFASDVLNLGFTDDDRLVVIARTGVQWVPIP